MTHLNIIVVNGHKLSLICGMSGNYHFYHHFNNKLIERVNLGADKEEALKDYFAEVVLYKNDLG